MIHAPVGLYVASVSASTAAMVAAESTLPIWIVVMLAMAAPTVPVIVGFLLTSRKLKTNSAQMDDARTKVEEIHLLVDGRLDAALSTLQEVLKINVGLKDQLGHYVSEHERTSSEGLHDLALSEMQIKDIHEASEQVGQADGPTTTTKETK